MRSSHEKVWFKWRGPRVKYGDRGYLQGWIKFLGDGQIELWLDAYKRSFRGSRIPHQGTRSRIDARSMKDEFDGYSDQYERENRAHW